jgi:hypothetical protein
MFLRAFVVSKLSETGAPKLLPKIRSIKLDDAAHLVKA